MLSKEVDYTSSVGYILTLCKENGIVAHRRQGIEKVLYEFEGVVLHSALSQAWLGLSPVQKRSVRRELRLLIRKHILGTELLTILAQDILTETGIATATYLYQYIKRVYYSNNSREMLVALQSAVQEKHDKA